MTASAPDNQFATTVSYPREDPAYRLRAKLIEMPKYGYFKKDSIREQFQIFKNIIKTASAGEKALLLFSSRGSLKPELMAIVWMSFWPQSRRPAITLVGDMWEPDSGLKLVVEKILIRLADRAIQRYVVYSSAELKIFPENWSTSPHKMRFVEYIPTIHLEKIDPNWVIPGDAIFSGGNPFRDYDSLIETAKRMPDRKFIIATRLLDNRTDLPENVRAGSVPPEEFNQLLCGAGAVIVPMQTGLRRSVGHQTYLNAMLLGKPVVVNDVHGVRDHIRDHKTGLIVDGSPESYYKAIQEIFDPNNQNAIQKMCANACDDAKNRFTIQNHAAKLMRYVDEAIAERYTHS
jgi:glycosyltransferase involved in cell wall biosynthesis